MIESNFIEAKKRYEAFEIDVEAALEEAAETRITLPCWPGGAITLAPEQPVDAREPQRLQSLLTDLLKRVPGDHRIAIPAMFADEGAKVDRDELEPHHFAGWIAWAREQKVALDLNTTCFNHRLAASGTTLTNRDEATRAFWVRHCQAARRIGAAMGSALGTATITTQAVPDVFDDPDSDRLDYRDRLLLSLDEIFAEPLNAAHNIDAVISKNFGGGVAGELLASYDFILGYAYSRQKMLILDLGAQMDAGLMVDRVTGVLPWIPEYMMMVSGAICEAKAEIPRYGHAILQMMREVVRSRALMRVRFGLEPFSIGLDRPEEWVIAARAMRKALLMALIELRLDFPQLHDPSILARRLEAMDEIRKLPIDAIWRELCRRQGVAAD